MEQYVDDPEIRFFGIRELNYFSFMNFTGQGGGLFPKGPTNRFFACAFWLFAYITVSSYAANMGANLTLNRMITRRESFDSIINQKTFDWGLLEKSEPWDYFEKMATADKEFYR